MGRDGTWPEMQASRERAIFEMELVYSKEFRPFKMQLVFQQHVWQGHQVNHQRDGSRCGIHSKASANVEDDDKARDSL